MIIKWEKWAFSTLSFFAFNHCVKVAKAELEICGAYGEGIITEGFARDLYVKFKNENSDFWDVPRSGRLVEFYEEQLNQLLYKNPLQTPRKLTEKIECPWDWSHRFGT